MKIYCLLKQEKEKKGRKKKQQKKTGVWSMNMNQGWISFPSSTARSKAACAGGLKEHKPIKHVHLTDQWTTESLRPKLQRSQLAHPPAKNKENSASRFTNVPGAYVVAAVLPKPEKKYKKDTYFTVIVTPVITEPGAAQDGSNASEDCSPRRHNDGQ